MPTISLYSHEAHPDGCHRVTSPGGYEWWHFEARAVEDERIIVARLSCGLPFDRSYVRQYWRYRRHPTRIAPPRPTDFIEARLDVYRGAVLEHSVVTRHTADEFSAASDRPEVSIGPNTWRDSLLSISGPDQAGRCISAQLTFRPRSAVNTGENDFMPQSFPGDHRWIIGAGLCDVGGQLQVQGTTGETMIAFRGVGNRDHQYGSDLPAQNGKRWFHGRAIGDDGTWCVAFHHVQPRDWRASDELHLVEVDSRGVASEREIDTGTITWDWSRPTVFLQTYPLAARFGDVLNLARGRAIVSSPFDVQVMYDAEHRGTKGRALCSVTDPQRLRWRLR